MPDLTRRAHNLFLSLYTQKHGGTLPQKYRRAITSGLAIMAGKSVAETLVDAFVNENAHLRMREQQVLRFFEGGEGGFPRDGGKPLQKCFECFSAFEVVEERLDRHSRSAKHGSSAENLRVFYDDFHARIVPRATQAEAERRTDLKVGHYKSGGEVVDGSGFGGIGGDMA